MLRSVDVRFAASTPYFTARAYEQVNRNPFSSPTAGMDGDRHHQTEKASAVRPYLQDVGRPTAEVNDIGMVEDERRPGRWTCTEMDRRHSDVMR